MKKMTGFHTIRVMLPMAYRAAPLRFWAINVLGISQSVMMAVKTVLLAKFVDALVFSAGQLTIGSRLLLWTVLYVAGIIGCQLLNTLFNYVLDEYLEICGENFRFAYHGAVSGLNPLEFESSAFLDEIGKAETGLERAGVFVFHFIGILDMVPPYIIFLCFYMSTLNPWLLLCMIAAFLPSGITLYMQKNIRSRFADTAAPLRRRYEGYKDCITARQYFGETRILSAGRFFFQKAANEWGSLCREEVKTRNKSNLLDLFRNTAALAGYTGALLILVVSVLNGSVSVGSFAAVYNSLEELFDMMYSMVCGFIGSTAAELPEVENYVRFLEESKQKSGALYRDKRSVQESPGEVAPDFGKGIVLDKVSFSYPDAARQSVKEISLKIPRGQHVAIVGENGAGKSTLARLILGIYLPDSGRIDIGGLNTREAAPGAYQKYMSAVFQNFGRYRMLLDENVKISDFQSGRDSGEVLQGTGLDPEIIKNRDSVMLCREFGGMELSGGLWQQVAIARGRYRDHEIIVLDEPTAALDPVTESAVYHRFLEMVKGKTAFIVSHRLGSARLADRILVMQEGRLEEDGTHEELLRKNGLYRKMWDAQAESYHT